MVKIHVGLLIKNNFVVENLATKKTYYKYKQLLLHHRLSKDEKTEFFFNIFTNDINKMKECFAVYK